MDTAPAPTTTDIHTEVTGRVVRLHFQCVAELPMGSFLRVTSSTLWAPGSAATDPTEATPALQSAASAAEGFTTSTTSTSATTGRSSSKTASSSSKHPPPLDDSTNTTTGGGLYTSSVEMVTSPEKYPLWWTRRPVVVVLHNPRKTVQHHYYRYLVVSPGGTAALATAANTMDSSTTSLPDTTTMPLQDPTTITTSTSQLVVSTSNEMAGSTAVWQWEDPFGILLTNRTMPQESSMASLASSIVIAHTNTSNEYRNLPYRTVDIPVSDSGSSGTSTSTPSTLTITNDRWSNTDDATFRAYRIREALQDDLRRKQALLQPRMSDISDRADDATDDVVMAMNTTHLMDNTNDNAMNPKDTIERTTTAAAMSSDSMAASASTSDAGTPPAFSQGNRIFFVCFHLPVVVVKNEQSGEWNASWSESILAKTEGSQILNNYDCTWVGTVTTHPPIQNEQDKQAVTHLLENMNCCPIFLNPEIQQAHYYGFCKQVLWPAFHNIDLLDLNTCGWLPSKEDDSHGGASDWDQSRLDDWWKAYMQVNQVFSQTLSQLVKRNDILWIHDYHLSLLPQLQTEHEVTQYGCKTTRKVFFLHIPFPTSQIFREIECGEKILQGMLHADVVGFHAFDHARHFLNAAKRILGLNYESLVGGLIGVNFKSSTVLVSMNNVSIEPRMVDAVLLLPSVQAGKDALRAKHGERMIIGGVDIGQRLSGTALKLLAYERLLQDYPVWRSKVVMVERLLLPGSRKADEDLTTKEVRALITRIQEKFGPDVIDYQELAGTSLPMDQRLALWKASDVLMTTPIREGLNHWPMEYIFAHKAPETPGVVITSEFSAVSSILNGALRVNPYDIPMAIVTLDKALSMPLSDREGRRYRDIDFVSSSPSDKWVKNVLRDLRDATTRQSQSSNTSTPYATPTPTLVAKDPTSTTAGFLAREASLAFGRLHLRGMKRAYDAANRRVIILDFNGTIVLKEPPGKYLKREILGTSGNKPPQAVLDALSQLSQDPRNLIYVVSGDSVENVIGALGSLTGVGLAVSNGARFSPPLQPGQRRREWNTFDLGVDWAAVKRVALPVLSKYTARSNGSFVKLTSFSIGWSYYSCDPEWGSLQAAHLVMELESELRAFDVRFVTLKGIVEVVPRKLNKGLIVSQVLRDTDAANPAQGVDFVLCFGDDISDEKMFTSVFSFLAEKGDESNCKPGPPILKEDGTVVVPPRMANSSDAVDRPTHAFAVAVGKKPSHATCYVDGAQEVANALILLAQGQIPEGGVSVWGEGGSQDMFET